MFRRITGTKDLMTFSKVMRRRRFELFKELIRGVPKPVRILDVGGSYLYWQTMNFTNEPGHHITLLNLYKQEVDDSIFNSMIGDARDLSMFHDNEFDIVFSNSVIEHLGDYNNQKKMAQEVRRVGKKYYIQTPNYYFPIEPHFLFPGFQWLPIAVRIFLRENFKIGWLPPPTKDAGRAEVKSIRLLTKNDLLALFPEATIHHEKIFGLTKSFVAIFDDRLIEGNIR
jgi:hypothetical protein